MTSTTQGNLDSKLNLSDIVLIESMKADEDYAEFDPNIDLNISAELKRLYSNDNSKWLPRLIAQRASLYQHVRKGGTADAILHYLGQVRSVVIFVSLPILLVAFFRGSTIAQWLFSGVHNEANLFRLIWLLPIPLGFSFIALVCSLLLFRKPNGSTKKPSWTSNWISTFSVPGMIGEMWNCWCRLRRTEPSSVEASLERFASSKRRIASIAYLVTSNLIVLILSIFSLIAIFVFLSGENVRYTWESSNFRSDSVADVVRTFGYLPLVNAPSDEAIEWAVDSEYKDDALSQKATETFRIQWSKFIEWGIFVTAVIPRLLILLISVLLVRSAKKELLPKPGDSELAKIATGIISPPIVSETETKVQEIGSNEIPEVVGETPPTTAELQKQLTPKQTCLVGYQLRPESVELIAERFDDTNVNCEHVSGAKSRSEFLDSLRTSNLSAVVLFVRATVVPDLAFKSFAQKIHALCLEQGAQIKTVLFDSNAYLESVSGNVDVLKQREAEWEKSLVNAEVDLNQLVIADLDSVSGIDQIREHLEGSLGAGAVVGNAKMAGRFTKSLDLIKKELLDACHSDQGLSSEDWNRRCEELRAQVIQIYEREYSSLLDSIKLPTSSGFEASVASGFEQIKSLENFDSTFDAVKDSLGKLKALEGYFKNLSPKWMVAGAIAGVGATAALPLLVGGAAAAPLMIAALPYSGLGGAGIGQGLKSFLTGKSDSSNEKQNQEDSESYAGLNLDMSVRSMSLLVLLLEYQEFPREFSNRKIMEHTDSCGDIVVDSDSNLVMFVEKIKSCLQRDWEAMQ